MEKIKHYFSLVKFSHTVFAMPFALTGMMMAIFYFHFDVSVLQIILILLCMVFARNAAMGFNRYADRFIDAENPRTSNREIPAGIIKPQNALMFVIINSVLFITCTWFLNMLCFILSFPSLFVILAYSYTKRFTSFSHIILGLSLAIAPVGAFLAISGEFKVMPIILSAVVLLWTAGFDIIYSLQDEEFDKNNKLFSMPSKLGTKYALLFSELMHIAVVAFIVLLGIIFKLKYLYYIGVVIFTIMLIWQHLLVNKKTQRNIGFAFGTTNGIASVLYGLFTITDFIINSNYYPAI